MTVNTAISSITPIVSGGAVTSYTLSTLPTGLRIDASTGVISGTPTAISSARNYTITATNSGGSATGVVISITVNDVVPSSVAYSGSPFTFTKSSAITSKTPTASGGTITSCASSPTLPSGLALSSACVISGTPTAISSATNYTITATNSGGSATGVVISITVNDIAPSGLTYSTSPATYTQNVAITQNTASTSGGGAVVSYSISASLPTGFSFNTSTGAITGTPTVTSAATAYTITATNTGGSTTVSLTITVSAGGGGGAAPTITSITPPANGTYGLNNSISFIVNYSAAVTVTGTPDIGITIGAGSTYATYVSGSTTTALTFTYVVQPGDMDSDGISANSAVELLGGTLKSGTNVDADLAFTAPNLSGVLVDTSLGSACTGGCAAVQSERPSLIVLQDTSTSPPTSFCMGVIIDTLTAIVPVQCVIAADSSNPKDLDIVAAEQELNKDSGIEQRRTVTRIIPHENYVSRTKENDIAILKISDPFNFDSNVAAAVLPAEGKDFSRGINAAGYAWIDTENRGSNVLQAYFLTTMSAGTANVAWSNAVYPGMLAFSNDEASRAPGLGAPYYSADGTVMGLMSWGMQVPTRGYPYIAVDLSYYISWIESNR